MDYEEEEEMAGYLCSMDQREREEMEFYTDLAVQEMQRWIEVCPLFHFLGNLQLSLGLLLLRLI